MKPLTGVVKKVGKGEVKVRVDNGYTYIIKTDKTFKYAEKVLVFYDYHRLRAVDICRPGDIKEIVEEPEHDPDETTVEAEESGSDGSLPLRVGDELSDVDSDSESESSFQFFEGEFGEFPDEPD